MCLLYSIVLVFIPGVFKTCCSAKMAHGRSLFEFVKLEVLETRSRYRTDVLKYSVVLLQWLPTRPICFFTHQCIASTRPTSGPIGAYYSGKNISIGACCFGRQLEQLLKSKSICVEWDDKISCSGFRSLACVPGAGGLGGLESQPRYCHYNWFSLTTAPRLCVLFRVHQDHAG